MSGGSYNYVYRQVQDSAEQTTAILKLFGEIAHDIEWGDSCDYCPRCTDMRVLKAIRLFMEDGCRETENAIGALGNRAIVCDSCKERDTPNVMNPIVGQAMWQSPLVGQVDAVIDTDGKFILFYRDKVVVITARFDTYHDVVPVVRDYDPVIDPKIER